MAEVLRLGIDETRMVPPPTGTMCPWACECNVSFGGLAISERPMALRPNLAVGLPLSGKPI